MNRHFFLVNHLEIKNLKLLSLCLAVISLGKIDTNIIPIISGSIFCFLNRLLNNYEGTILFDHIIITNMIIAVAKLFTIIPFIILKIRTRKIHSIDIQNKNDNHHEKIIKINGQWSYILLSAIIHFIQITLFIYTVTLKTNYWIFYSLLYFII